MIIIPHSTVYLIANSYSQFVTSQVHLRTKNKQLKSQGWAREATIYLRVDSIEQCRWDYLEAEPTRFILLNGESIARLILCEPFIFVEDGVRGKEAYFEKVSSFPVFAIGFSSGSINLEMKMIAVRR